MIVKIVPTTSQIIWNVKAALGSLESASDTLAHDPQLAISEAANWLRQLLEYLNAVNRADDVMTEFGPETFEPSIRLKGFVDDGGKID